MFIIVPGRSSWYMIKVKRIYRRFTWGGGVVLKQLNYSITMLPVVFRSVDLIVNDHQSYPCLSYKFPHFYDLTKNVDIKKSLSKKQHIVIKMYLTTNLQINWLYTFYFIKKSSKIIFYFEPFRTYFRNVI